MSELKLLDVNLNLDVCIDFCLDSKDLNLNGQMDVGV